MDFEFSPVDSSLRIFNTPTQLCFINIKCSWHNAYRVFANTPHHPPTASLTSANFPDGEDQWLTIHRPRRSHLKSVTEWPLLFRTSAWSSCLSRHLIQDNSYEIWSFLRTPTYGLLIPYLHGFYWNQRFTSVKPLALARVAHACHPSMG